MDSDQRAISPPSLSAKYEGSFAYLTVKDRMPTILTKVIDTIHRNKNNFFEEHGEEGVEAEKKAISFLSKLRNELQTDKPVLPVTDTAEDADVWNRYLLRQQDLMEDGRPVSWFKSPWLFVECYMYRKIQEALWLSPPICDYDVFGEGKMRSFLESQQAIVSLCSYLSEVLSSLAHQDQAQVKEQFLKFLQVSLWGNKCDLSISAGQDNFQKTSPVDSLSDLQHFILVDDSEKLWSALRSARMSRVDFVLDNAGFELLADLVLAHYLVSTGLTQEVRFHGKSIPWFVSDVNERDFNWVLTQTAASNHRQMSACGVQWKRFVQEGRWSYHAHPFWTLPHEFCDMAAEAPDLYASLRGSDVVLFKGDLNYRRLTGDRAWDHTLPFAKALRGFHPAPLCSLRTLKANVQVGLRPGQAKDVALRDPDWMTSGKYAVIQFSEA